MTRIVRCPSHIIVDTLSFLRAGGAANTEIVVLWLGIDRSGTLEVQEAYRPEQEVHVDYFRIPPASMRTIMTHIRETRRQIVAQVHSHPGQAFHSKADDAWAIVRHVGAVSIVVPDFAQNTDDGSFGGRVATYQLDSSDRWVQVQFAKVVEVV